MLLLALSVPQIILADRSLILNAVGGPVMTGPLVSANDSVLKLPTGLNMTAGFAGIPGVCLKDTAGLVGKPAVAEPVLKKYCVPG